MTDVIWKGKTEMSAKSSAPWDSFASMDVTNEVLRERQRQHYRWGQQDHPDGTGGGARATWEKIAKLSCDRNARKGTLTYAHILDEECSESLAETDPAKLRGELIQVAAVAVAWIESIDRRRT